METIKIYVENLDPSLDSTKSLKSRRELKNMKGIERKLVTKGKFISLGNNQTHNFPRVAIQNALNVDIGKNREMAFSEFHKVIQTQTRW